MVDTTQNAPAAPAAGAISPADYAPAAPAAPGAPAPAPADPYAAQIQQWKGQYRDVYEIEVFDREGQSVRCFHSNPSRPVIAQVITMVMNKKPIEAGEFLLMESFIGGDERLNPNNPHADDAMVIAAAKEAAGNIELLSARSKKL